MEQFKIEHFKSEHPDHEFPSIGPIAERDIESLRERWFGNLDAEPDTDPLKVLTAIDSRSEPVPGTADEESFNLRNTLERLGVSAADTVYINWDRFDTIDAIALRDLSDHFQFIWYPGADDIEIFDATCTWMLLVRHYGGVQIFRVKR
jgi:hypothetical protein